MSNKIPGPLLFKNTVIERKEKTYICVGPTTGYRDGVDGVVEVMSFLDGWLSHGWFDTPSKCENYTGSHDTTKYVKVV